MWYKLEREKLVILALKLSGQGWDGWYNSNVSPLSFSAPATAPREVSARPISASTIFIRWAPPRKPNGVIQGYNVYYTTRPSQGLSAWFKHSVSGDSERVTTISDLTTMQIYTISVSAYTSVGEGPASDHIQVKTQQGGKFSLQICYFGFLR